MSILLGDSCGEIRVRHDLHWTEVEFGLLYNCDSKKGHYSGIRRDDEMGVEAKKVKEGDNYSSTEDKRDKSQLIIPQGMVVVSVEKLKCLMKDSALAQKVRDLVTEQTGSQGGTSGTDGGSKSKKRVETEKEPGIDKELQGVKSGDIHCTRCNKDFENTPQLKKHLKLYHSNVYTHICTVCDKGFHSMEAIRRLAIRR